MVAVTLDLLTRLLVPHASRREAMSGKGLSLPLSPYRALPPAPYRALPALRIFTPHPTASRGHCRHAVALTALPLPL